MQVHGVTFTQGTAVPLPDCTACLHPPHPQSPKLRLPTPAEQGLITPRQKQDALQITPYTALR